MTTIKDIAKLAGVSTTTVSKFINNKTFDLGDETVKRVQKIIIEENYVPNHLARSMRTNKTMTIGLIIPDIRNPFFTDMARGVEDAGHKYGYNIILANSDDSFSKELTHMQSMVQKKVDGIIIVGSTERDKKMELNINFKIPGVAIDRPINYPFIVSTVLPKHSYGAFNAVQYLLYQGHSKILHLAGPKSHDVSLARLNGYKRAVEKHGLTYSIDDVIFGEFSTSSGYDRIIHLDNVEKYTAIFCSNDMIAFGALSALNERNILVPGQMSIMGFDDVEYAKLVYPSLTTVDQASYQMGEVAVQALIKNLNNKKTEKTIELKQRLVIRKSVRNLVES